MINDNDKSYEQYKQYRLNSHRYNQEQIVFPLSIIIGLAIIIGLLKYLLIAIFFVLFLAAIACMVFLYLKKQLKSDRVIVLSKEDAHEGVDAEISVVYNSQVATFIFNIPSNVKNGQKFIARNIVFKNKKGRNIKKNVHFKVQVL